MLRVRGRLLLGAVLAPVLLALVPAAPPSAFAAPATTTFVTMVGESGNSILGDASRVWRPQSGSVTLKVADGQFDVTVSGGSSGEAYDLVFAAPPGRTLKPGSYEAAQRTPFRTAGHPGIDIFGEGHGCNESDGRFTVLDAPSDHSRLWLTYEEHCDHEVPAVFGEVRINEPDSLVVTAAPDRIDWPATYPDVNGRIVPVTLFNNGKYRRMVDDKAITDGDADFSVVGDTCANGSPVGGSCEVYVRFNPQSVGRRTGTLLITNTAGEVHRIALSGTGFAGDTAWDLHSQGGDPIGGGSDWSYAPSDSTLTAGGSETHVWLRATSQSEDWTADFAPDAGHLLLAGTSFDATQRYVPGGSSSTPMLRVERLGHTCDRETGSFTVRQAAYEEGRLTSFQADFTQYCDDASDPLTGTISWRADPGDTDAPGPVTLGGVSTLYTTATLNWTNPSDSDFADSVVRQSTGDVPPPTVGSGTRVYEGLKTWRDVTGLEPGTDYSFSIFPRDTNGHVGPSASVTLRGTNLSLRRSTSTLRAGDSLRLSGQLTDARTGHAMAGRPISVYARSGGFDWHDVAELTTDANGHWETVRREPRNTEYHVVYAQPSLPRLGAQHDTSVKVAPKVSLHADHTHGSRHARFRLGSHLYPNESGLPVTLQRLSSGHWRNVTTKPLDASSNADFVVSPGRKGTYSFRVLRLADPTHLTGTSRVVKLYVS